MGTGAFDSAGFDARVVGVLWRLPAKFRAAPIAPVPEAWRRRLDRMDAAGLRGLLAEVVHRLEQTEYTEHFPDGHAGGHAGDEDGPGAARAGHGPARRPGR